MKHQPSRRWSIALALLLGLALAYPASEGPAVYAAARSWLPHEVYAAAYAPFLDSIGRPRRFWQPFRSYHYWWHKLAMRHLGFDPALANWDAGKPGLSRGVPCDAAPNGAAHS